MNGLIGRSQGMHVRLTINNNKVCDFSGIHWILKGLFRWNIYIVSTTIAKAATLIKFPCLMFLSCVWYPKNESFQNCILEKLQSLFIFRVQVKKQLTWSLLSTIFWIILWTPYYVWEVLEEKELLDKFTGVWKWVDNLSKFSITTPVMVFYSMLNPVILLVVLRPFWKPINDKLIFMLSIIQRIMTK